MEMENARPAEGARRWAVYVAAAVLFGATGLAVGWQAAWKLHYEGIPFLFFYLLASAGSILAGVLALIPRLTRRLGLPLLLGAVSFQAGWYAGLWAGHVLGPTI
jgi:hypothetical protein